MAWSFENFEEVEKVFKKRHIKRFPADFMFELSYQEFMNLRCQIGTSNRAICPWSSPNRVWRCFPASSTTSGQFGTWKANVPEIYIEDPVSGIDNLYLSNTTIWSFTGGRRHFFLVLYLPIIFLIASL